MDKQYNDIKNLVKEAGVEHPSNDFLHNVMNEVKITSTKASTLYTPLISKKSWMMISVFSIGLLAFGLFLSEGTSIMDRLELSFLAEKGFKNPLAGFKFHTTTIYGIIFMTVLFVVQITIIKRRIDRRFAL
ncbi:hypothetical protein [Aquimarina sp. 2201CG14-23]|uniref:hypothetical protein n=1 Tax=Aquimarina mycalae TaxID=3040073 RepID=UPI0024782AAF|nr:hypothetical protein [Aquimarina sp. 2201CG14-23]MDH7444438.1 hypothetical protein [Aquimarina sp. 2201CG14-23]